MAEMILTAADLRNLERLAGPNGSVVVRPSEVLRDTLVVGKTSQ